MREPERNDTYTVMQPNLMQRLLTMIAPSFALHTLE